VARSNYHCCHRNPKMHSPCCVNVYIYIYIYIYIERERERERERETTVNNLLDMEGIKLEAQARVFLQSSSKWTIRNTLRSSSKVSNVFIRIKIWNFVTDFRKSLQYQISRKSHHWQLSWCMRANRQRAGLTVMTNLIVACCYLCERDQ